MKRYALALLLTLAFAVCSFAQATVTATVTDANNNAYFPGTVSAYISLPTGQALPVGVPASGSIGPNATTAGGAFSVTIPVTGYSWIFTVCGPPVNLGPRGNPTPTQTCFTTPAILISASTSITGSLGTIPLLGPGGSSSSSGSVGAIQGQGVLISPNCGGATNCYGVNGNTKYISDATFTNGSNVVSCPNSDCNFTSADTGKTCWGTNATTDVSTISSVVALPEGTFTQTGAQTGTCSGGNASNSGAAGANFFVWGTLDTPANGVAGTDNIAAASLAAANACQPLNIAPGVYQIEQAEFNVGPTNGFCNQNSAVNTRKGFIVAGLGSSPTAAVLLLTPNFSGSSNAGGTGCNGPNGTGTACFLSLNNLIARGFEMTCLGNSSMGAGFNGKSLVLISGVPINGGSNFNVEDAYFIGCGAQTAGLTGINVGNGVSGAISGGLITNSIVEAFGNTMFNFNPGVSTSMIQVANDQFTGCGNSGCVVVNNGFWSSVNTFYGYSSSTVANAVTCTGTTTYCSFKGDYFPYVTGTGTAQLAIINGAHVKISHTILNNPVANSYGISYATGATYTYAEASTITATTTQDGIFCNNGTCNFYDLGGNIFSGESGIGTYQQWGSPSFTGVPLTTGGVSLGAGFGTGSAVSAASGSSPSMTWTATLGTGPTANATAVVTFPVGFLQAPLCTATQIGGTSTVAFPVEVSATATTATLTYVGTFVSGTVITRLTCSN